MPSRMSARTRGGPGRCPARLGVVRVLRSAYSRACGSLRPGTYTCFFGVRPAPALACLPSSLTIQRAAQLTAGTSAALTPRMAGAPGAPWKRRSSPTITPAWTCASWRTGASSSPTTPPAARGPRGAPSASPFPATMVARGRSPWTLRRGRGSTPTPPWWPRGGAGPCCPSPGRGRASPWPRCSRRTSRRRGQGGCSRPPRGRRGREPLPLTH
mmetsp:Transcript_25861/g.82280  ORF Transcript_25861/g.82280 Transcript_25861/m.82280 type:complete len:213 (+) Transcript_25861:660-1298(+)